MLFWRNDEDAVAAGAKPVDVEGVAKPTAARLMALARPNQILLSSVAEALLRPSQRELGERGANLQWKSHGRWYFKGLPTPQEVFEVGTTGSAPLRMPARSSKAWRRLPLWRRPAALVAELLLVVAVGAVAWVLVRPEPAIAFAERDWVVIGDFSNQTGNLVLDDALQQALRISLEQSRHVNVLSDLKVRETLRQMRKDPAQALDRATAKEIAIRDGARAVVMPGVQELYGKLRISIEVLDPVSGRVVYSAYADGDGLDSALGSLDTVAAAIRTKLGEAADELGRTSLPLPRVATSNLDALHAYAMGVDAYAEYRHEDALAYLEQAEKLDPDFAAAYMAQMRIAYSRGDTVRARELLAQAVAHRDDLTAREGLYLDAWGAEINGSGSAESAYKWKLLGDLYPDYHAAFAN
ncbi:MAG: putative peptide modification system cyclase, partial [Stenotrophomonas sp.]